MDYNCKICRYSTNDPSNFLRHNKSKKHISNIENISCVDKCVKPKENIKKNIERTQQTYEKNIIACNLCKKKFTTKTSMYRHRKHYCENTNETNNLKIEVNELKKQNEELLKLANTNAETANITAKTNKKTVHIMTHAINNFSDAPTIQQLSHNKSKKLLTEHAKDSSHSVEDLMIHNQEN
jgi:CHAT domain-containing protein